MKKVLGLVTMLAVIIALVVAAVPTQTTVAQGGTVTIESWRTDDLTIWEDVIIPAFNEEYPDIEVVFSPTNPPDYNAALNAKLESGTAGDLITCRPFDDSLALFNDGHLASLNDLAGMEHFNDLARSAWITDDGSDVFCVPMASVIHGFIYNADAFAEVGVEEPTTYDEFYAVLDAIKEDGTYIPMAMGTIDQWEAATMGYQNIGPAYWGGEDGRLALISGDAALNDPEFVAPLEELVRWTDYLADGYQAQSYSDSQNAFTLGLSAIYPSGSWEINLFNSQADFAMGAFPPPTLEGSDTCYISDHVDIAMGVNTASENQEAAMALLEWMTGPEFAEMYSNQLPGFFSLSDHDITLEDPLAQEFLSWRGECEGTIRSSYQILSRGEPNLENEMWRLSASVMNGDISPQDAADELQAGLEGWYEPQMP